MCGICGLLGDLDPQQAGACVKRMADSIRHRGPDDEGFHAAAPAFLGHRRLSIVDLSTGHQPIANEDGTVWTIFNGEIYNHAALRADLEQKGHRYRTRTDTESIVHLYEEDGLSFPRKLNGMFAIALWDAPRQRLVLVRDRLGIKPLYYAELAGGALAFASEMKALLQCPGVDTTVDPVALDGYLALQYVPGPRTIYRGIHKLPAGHTLVAESGEITIEPYWTLEPAPAPRSFNRARDEFRALFDDAVRVRLMSDVPLGAFLSGGIDSGLVVAAMAKAMDRPVQTFSIGFETEGWYSELPYAARVAEHLKTDHKTLTVSALDMRSLLPVVAAQLDEPLADPAAVPTYLLSRFAREHVTVALTGEGADELFAGYNRYRFEAMRDKVVWLPPGARRALRAVGKPVAGRRYARALDAATMDSAASFVFLRSVMPPELRGALLRPEIAAQLPPDHLEARVAAHFSGADGLNASLRADTLEWLPDDLLMKVDKMSMLASLEARVPFLDYRIVEQVSGFPAAWKHRGGRSKVLLKAAAEGVLPPDIINRRKHGFTPPIGVWMRGSLRGYMEENLLDPAALSAQWLESRVVSALAGRFLRGEDRFALPVWVLLCLEVWLRSGSRVEAAAS
ncbi:MAG: asparagine synthase (glutamine-hydrolyzing) [Candidatus Krumholzibacteria bacterium]|nr:asparagine synthase (glutamine-hydrolyzing) [Candidatus Krumholzibacteria bacterium]MDH4335695.1 asparagine synthase (glutamine-hydrolyzing) [Candidatus Krumholzibacteria bacterium]MDH5270040.1 asparagine synthase (glutamine-hydrolyzing) [Candidatus Krumholzibacteria bacterium]